MTPKASATLSVSSSLLCFGGAVLLFVSIGDHGFLNGMALGLGAALVLLGAVLFGATIAGNQRHRLGWWRPSRDRGEAAGAGDE